MKNKLIALLLAVLMCSSLFVACSSGKKTQETTGSNNNTVEETDETILKINDYVANLAANHKVAGNTFSYIGGGGQTAEDEEETGTLENDALYKRQRELEETLGITWNSVVAAYDEGSTAHAVTDYVKTAVMANSKDYDLVYGTLVVTTQPLFNEDCLEDISEFSVTNLDEEWWPATIDETHSIGGKIFFLTGPILTTYYSDASCILFNKAVAANYGIEAPYDYVTDGTWTFDKMFEVASAIPLNTTGTGDYRYGEPKGLALLFANGMTITKFDDEGVPYVEPTLPSALVDLCDKFSAVMGDDSQTAIIRDYVTENTEDKFGYKSFNEMFTDGKILFYFAHTATAATLRENDVEFGILPYPKGSSSQSQYYSYANNWDACFCAVPRCTRDINVTDVVLEAMAALSLKHIEPAYYEKLLKGRSTHDTDSRKMLDIIFDTKIYDIIDIYSLGDINQSGTFVRGIEKAMVYDSSTLSSEYAIGAKMANQQIAKIMKMIND